MSDPLCPAELVLARWHAFRRGDFGFVWDCAHPESNFRQVFPDRPAYRDYGRKVLAGEFDFLECRILAEDVRGKLARVLAWQRFRHLGGEQAWFEWIRMRGTPEGWRIFQTARLASDAFAGAVENFSWADFERLCDMEFF